MGSGVAQYIRIKEREKESFRPGTLDNLDDASPDA